MVRGIAEALGEDRAEWLERFGYDDDAQVDRQRGKTVREMTDEERYDRAMEMLALIRPAVTRTSENAETLRRRARRRGQQDEPPGTPRRQGPFRPRGAGEAP